MIKNESVDFFLSSQRPQFFQPFKTLPEEDGEVGGREKRREGLQLFMENQLLEGQVNTRFNINI